MGEPAKVFDLAAITCNFLGIPLDEMGGWGDGGGMTLTPGGPAFITRKGADGSVVRSATHDNTWTIKLVVLQTAAVNDVLSGILQLDTSTENGAGVGPFLVRNRLSNTDAFFGSKAWIEGWPEKKYLQQAENLEWTIFVANGKPFWGGS